MLYVRVSCLVVRGCAASRRYINACNCDMFSVVYVYLDHLKFCVVCIDDRRYVCCSECNVVFNECLNHWSQLINPGPTSSRSRGKMLRFVFVGACFVCVLVWCWFSCVLFGMCLRSVVLLCVVTVYVMSMWCLCWWGVVLVVWFRYVDDRSMGCVLLCLHISDDPSNLLCFLCRYVLNTCHITELCICCMSWIRVDISRFCEQQRQTSRQKRVIRPPSLVWPSIDPRAFHSQVKHSFH